MSEEMKSYQYVKNKNWKIYEKPNKKILKLLMKKLKD